MNRPARYWRSLDDEGRVQCTLCPRACRLRPGQRGYCFVRANQDGRLVLTTYGLSSGFCIDPIEKKPLNHFLPGSAVLSFGTAGCNLGCKYCQNWDISTSREMERLSDAASPGEVARAAESSGCAGVAYTYNDPIVFAEYAIDTALACRERGLANIAVTAGYVCPEGRRDLFSVMDAVNVDLKGFSNDFYRTVTGAELQPVLDTIMWLVHEADAWVELTTLLIPGTNDASSDIRAMCRWIVGELGPDVPLHFTAFHPAHRMLDVPATPSRTLARARLIGYEAGLHYVYTGNVHDPAGQTTHCPTCSTPVVARDRYTIDAYLLDEHGCCPVCGTRIAGRFGERAGDFGSHRIPIRLSSHRDVGSVQ
ncbi:AmmeMemoRadiSam system radical SAM enzyme [Brooklawnia cerclae]|uniref:Pyruvate formate lyase activating enzyme n=1 Tax=Brooklawnia cerclae TaxID=349934 RepID=A0ABX0SII4_9ACTN|nr:AmmeMemoRadiSam system radical SAM enzyme [Brooklawnia cerclae]NIH58198.1 pyruvate formate lyase activating enzyme [Brooklawnia cerclae]